MDIGQFLKLNYHFPATKNADFLIFLQMTNHFALKFIRFPYNKFRVTIQIFSFQPVEFIEYCRYP